MKKVYKAPTILVATTDLGCFLAGSGVIGKIDNSLEIGYYGADEDGALDPAANGFNNHLWDESE